MRFLKLLARDPPSPAAQLEIANFCKVRITVETIRVNNRTDLFEPKYGTQVETVRVATESNQQKLLNQMVDSLVHRVMLNQMVKDNSLPLDRVFHALAHPARRAILRRLAGGERNLTELAAPLEMSFPAASKHVRVLELAKLVRRRVVGRTHICRIEGEPLAQANQWLEEYRKVWEANFERLDDLLDELKSQEAQTESKQGDSH